jgi:hypothetical protein
MLNLVLTLLCVLPQAPVVSQTVSVHGVPIAYTLTDPVTGLSVPVAASAGLSMLLEPAPPADPTEKAQTLSTTVKDPDAPEEPITVTTIRGVTESAIEFWRRHDEMVRLVRKQVAKKD